MEYRIGVMGWFLVIVRLIKKTKIYNFSLPTKIAGNYWITDNDYLGNTRNLINVEEYNGEWKIKSDFETKIMSGEKEVESAILKDYCLYAVPVSRSERQGSSRKPRSEAAR